MSGNGYAFPSGQTKKTDEARPPNAANIGGTVSGNSVGCHTEGPIRFRSSNGIAVRGGNATVKERANVVMIQLGTLVHTRVSAFVTVPNRKLSRCRVKCSIAF